MDPKQALIADMLAAGYVVGHAGYGQVGVRMYPAGPGVPCPLRPTEVEVLHDRIRVWEPRFFGVHYTRRSHWDTVTVAVCETVPEFLEWCRTNPRGTVSESEPVVNVYD